MIRVKANTQLMQARTTCTVSAVDDTAAATGEIHFFCVNITDDDNDDAHTNHFLRPQRASAYACQTGKGSTDAE
jgi:ribulose 1,5-bisphosphate carboxylase large subunit-like protein